MRPAGYKNNEIQPTANNFDFPGYNSSLAIEPLQRDTALWKIAEGNTSSEKDLTTKWDIHEDIFVSAIPSVFDLLATIALKMAKRSPFTSALFLNKSPHWHSSW